MTRAAALDGAFNKAVLRDACRKQATVRSRNHTSKQTQSKCRGCLLIARLPRHGVIHVVKFCEHRVGPRSGSTPMLRRTVRNLRLPVIALLWVALHALWFSLFRSVSHLVLSMSDLPCDERRHNLSKCFFRRSLDVIQSHVELRAGQRAILGEVAPHQDGVVHPVLVFQPLRASANSGCKEKKATATTKDRE